MSRNEKEKRDFQRHASKARRPIHERSEHVSKQTILWGLSFPNTTNEAKATNKAKDEGSFTDSDGLDSDFYPKLVLRHNDVEASKVYLLNLVSCFNLN